MFWCNIEHDKSTFGRVLGILEGINKTQEEEDITCGGGSGYWVLWNFKGRGSFPHVTKGDAEVLGI